MGYALFCNRKIALTSELNNYQLKLDQLQQQKMNLLNYAGVVADGQITADEYMDNPQIYRKLHAFDEGVINYLTVTDENGNEVLDSQGNPVNKVTQYVNDHLGIEPTTPNFTDIYTASCIQVEKNMREDYAKNVEAKKIAAEETKLDMQMKKLETKITAIQQELQSVEQAEKTGIQNATPKYAGLG